MEYQSENEPELLQRIATGCEAAFAAVFHHYYKRLVPFVRKHTNNETETEEIIQHVFIRVWVNRDKLPEIRHFQAWLFKVASREFLLFLRKKMADDRLLTYVQNSIPVSDTPQDKTQLNEIQKLIREAVLKQPEQRRRIYMMSRDEGLKIAEIAKALGISPNTVKNALTTTLKQIREHIAMHGYLITIVTLLSLL